LLRYAGATSEARRPQETVPDCPQVIANSGDYPLMSNYDYSTKSTAFWGGFGGKRELNSKVLRALEQLQIWAIGEQL
jgi:hypothetical protein